MAEDLNFVDNNAQRSAATAADASQVDTVRVIDYRVMPWPDGTRVTIEMGLTPFRQFPAMDVSIVATSGEVICSVSLIGTLERRPSPTLHLPQLPVGTRLAALIEMLDGERVTQKIIVPFEVAGSIVKKVVTS